MSDLIAEQTAALFKREKIHIPVKSCSLMETLAVLESASASDLASAMGRSHQIIMQKLPKLIELDLIKRQADPDDRRRFLHQLTKTGKEEVARLQKLNPKIAKAYRELEREEGPVHSQILAAIRSLEMHDLLNRI
ncbi:MAG: MarR family transcriptional regulator [Pseudomonadota bacterium]